MKKQEYIKADRNIAVASIVISAIATIGILTVAFGNINILWTLNVIPSLVQMINRK